MPELPARPIDFERERVVFTHIPKNAGTSVEAMLKSAFGDRYLVAGPELEPPADLSPYVASGGHFVSGDNPLERAGRRVVRVTVLRDPFERFLSYYHHVQRHAHHHLHELVLGVSPFDFARRLRWYWREDGTRDGQALFLTRRRWSFGLEHDLRTVLRRYQLVGVVGWLGDFVSAIQELVPGTPLVLPRQNVNPEPSPHLSDDSLRQYIYKINPRDTALYRHFLEQGRRPDAMTENAKTLHFEYQGISFDVDIEASETIISGQLARSSVWEENQLSVYPYLVGPAATIVDVGANVGINAIFAAKKHPDARLIAVEASPTNFALLERNVQRAQARNIVLHAGAVAAKDGPISFNGSGTNAHISHEGAPGGDMVDGIRLDTLFEKHRINRADLVKIDVEGYSDVVLAGATTALPRIKNLIMEFSIGDVSNRFQIDEAGVERHFAGLLATLGQEFPHVYYISRSDGLVRFSGADDLMGLLTVEHSVGDVLAARKPVPLHSIGPMRFALKHIAALLGQNHRRILEIGRLQEGRRSTAFKSLILGRTRRPPA